MEAKTIGPVRVGIIGDVHCEHEFLELALRHLSLLGINDVLCVGDVVDGFGDAQRCCELLEQHHVATVRGNHDSWYLDNVSRDMVEAIPAGSLDGRAESFLRALPATRTFQTPFGNAMLCHGLGVHNMATVTEDDYGYALEQNFELHELIDDPQIQIVINGHSHQPMVRHFPGLTIVNAGTLHRKCSPGLLTADFESGVIERYEISAGCVGTSRRLGALLLPR